jgi:hypothetical protein
MHPSFAGLTGYGAPLQPAMSEFDKWRLTQEAERAERERQADHELEREQRAADREVD